jgi:hypothetical protein
MKKKVLALALILVMALTFGLVACGTDTKNVEANLTKIEEVIAELKSALAANKLDLGTLQAALAGIDADTASLDQLQELAKIVTALSAQNTVSASLYEATAARLAAAGSAISGSATFYGGVHNLYLGKVTVTLANGLITGVVYDEYFLPGAYADLGFMYENDLAASDKVGAYAKFIQIGTAVFEIQTNADGTPKMTTANVTNTATQIAGTALRGAFNGNTATTPVYKQLGSSSSDYATGAIGEENGDARLITNLANSVFAHQSTAAWYTTAIAAGNLKILKEDASTGTPYYRHTNFTNLDNVGVKLKVAKAKIDLNGDGDVLDGGETTAIDIVSTNANKTFFSHWIHKQDGGYWAVAPDAGHTTGNRLGWAQNTDYVIAAAIATQLQIDASRFNNTGNIKQFAAGAIVTGATLTDFKDYWFIAQCAYINALTNQLDA